MQLRILSLAVITAISACNQPSKKARLVTASIGPGITQSAGIMADDDIRLGAFTQDFINENTEQFISIPGHNNIIRGKKGLEIKVDPTSLEHQDGSPVTGAILVRMIELTNSDDLFRSNAATISDGKLLASGGSYYIEMLSDGEKLKIKKGNSLTVNLPVLAENEMKLFYGQRDSVGNMNWVNAGQQFNRQDAIVMRDMYDFFSYPELPDSVSVLDIQHTYNSPDNMVFYYDQQMTVRDLVETLQKKGVDIFIDTSYVSCPSTLGKYDSCRKEWFLKQYRVVTGKSLRAENERLKQQELYGKARDSAYKKFIRDRGAVSLSAQLQKYYAPSNIRELGWINCDRFYDREIEKPVPLDLPITMSGGSIHYFVIFKSFNGLLSGRVLRDEKNQYKISGLPSGENITLVAFTKRNGVIYQSKTDCVIQKNKAIALDFQSVSAKEMVAMFKGNAKI